MAVIAATGCWTWVEARGQGTPTGAGSARPAPAASAIPQAPATALPRGGWTPLMHAARQGSLDAARALVNAPGIDLNLTDPDGTTALVVAIINAHYDVAAAILDKGANPNIPD